MDYHTIFGSLKIFYLSHFVISLLVAVVASYFLKKKFIDNRFKLLAFFLVFNISLPLVGYIMTIWIIYYLLHIKYEEQLSSVNFLNMIEFENEFPKINRVFGESAMGRLLSDDSLSASASLKMKALVSLSDNASKSDVALIKSSLSDRNDEVRLYSFAVIDGLERDINGQIHDKLQQFSNAKDDDIRAKRAEELAFLYWDLIYFELADSDLKKFIIKEVEKYAMITIDYDHNHEKINVLLGKAYLMNRDVDRAEYYFKIAIEHGTNVDFIIPYLAEIFFIKREFSKVRELLGNAKSLKINSMLYPVVAQWNKI